MSQALKLRIKERLSPELSGVLQYLHKSSSIDEDFGVFKMPCRSGIRKFVQNTLERLSVSTTEARRAESPIVNETPETNTARPMQDQLQLAIEKGLAKSPMPSGPANNLNMVLKREMALYESTGALGVNLNTMYNFLQTIPPTSVDSERAFSAAGILCTKFRSRLNDDTIDTLCYLRGFFHQQSKPR